MDTKEDREKKSLKKKNRIWMRLLFFLFFRSPFTAYLAISSYADPENPKRSNIIINIFICTDPVAIVTPCR